MKSKDQILLENLYELILFERKNLEDGKEFIGKMVEIHPVIKVGKDHPDYMKWSLKIVDGPYVGDVSNLHIKNVKSIINHSLIDITIRSEDKGNKQPYIKLYGELIDVNFSMEELRKKLSNGYWESVTYNPHKHPEYVYKNGLPSWWCGDERLGDNRGTADFTKTRINAMKEVMDREDFKSIKTLTQKSGNISSFSSEEAILKQHPTCNEDYMWIKGLK
jgi:hypothetical protein